MEWLGFYYVRMANEGENVRLDNKQYYGVMWFYKFENILSPRLVKGMIAYWFFFIF